MSCCGGPSIAGDQYRESGGGDPNNVTGDLNVDGDICLPVTKKLKIGATTYEEEKIVSAADFTINTDGNMYLTATDDIVLNSTTSNLISLIGKVEVTGALEATGVVKSEAGVNISPAVDNGVLLQVKNNRLTELGTEVGAVEHYVGGSAWEYQSDLQTQTGTQSIESTDTAGKPITIDGQGAATVRNQRPLSGHAFWDTSTNLFRPELAGDCYTFSLRAIVQSSSNTGSMTIRLKLTGGLTIDLGTLNFTDMDPHKIVKTTSVFAGDAFVAEGAALQGVGITGQGDTTLRDVDVLITRTHRGRPPVEPPFVPSAIVGLKGWYDDSSIVGTGTATAWNDKSSGQYHMATINTPPAIGTVNSRSVISFADGDGPIQSVTGGTESTTFTIFCVFETTGGSDYPVGSSNTGEGSWYFNPTSSTGGTFELFAGGFVSKAYTRPAGLNVVSVTVSATALDIYVNGSAAANQALVAPVGAGYAGVVSGSYGPGGPAITTGDVCEIVIYDRVLSTDDHNQVGGYLADRWGQTWVEITPPTPDTISGLQGWYNETGYVGSPITAWTDLSGNGHDLSSTNTHPTLTTVNFRDAALFSGASKLVTASGGNNSEVMTLFTVVEHVNGSQVCGTGNLSMGDWYQGAIAGDASLVVISTVGNESQNSPGSYPLFAVKSTILSQTTISQFVDGAPAGPVFTLSGDINGSSPGFVVGSFDPGQSPVWSGTACEFVLYNRVLTPAEHNIVGEYLTDKWGTPGWNTVS